MADALVFGGSNGLVSKLADGLADVLGVRVRYQHSAAEHIAPGVAICTTAEAFTAPAPLLVYADDEKPKNHGVDPNRVVALGVIAEAAASGRSTSIISSNAEARRWLEFLEDEGVPKNRPFRRLNIAGEAGVGKTTLANEIGPMLGLPVVSVDDVFWNDEETRNKGADGRRQQVNQILAKERWLAEGVYWRTAARLSAAADATLHLDFPSSRIRDQRDARGRPTRPLKEKVIVSTFVFAYPVIYERRLRRALSEIAHRGPIFEVRNDEELEAVRAGLVKGAGVAAADGPVGTE